MKIKNGYLLRTVAGQHIVLPADDKNTAFEGALVLNDTGVFLWRQLETENTRDGLVKALVASYEVDAVTAGASVDRMLSTFEKYGVLEA